MKKHQIRTALVLVALPFVVIGLLSQQLEPDQNGQDSCHAAPTSFVSTTADKSKSAIKEDHVHRNCRGAAVIDKNSGL